MEKISTPSRTAWIDYLRGFVTILVVAHHASLAYTTFASFNKTAYISSTHPVVDTMRWIGMDYFEDFNDIFFMSLMFLIAGIFVMGSLQKKGTGLFITDRFYRLLVPFFIGVSLLMLMAHYPAYYLAHGSFNLKDYVIDFFTVEAWPVGPPWFIWVLFVFNVVFAILYRSVRPLINKLGERLANCANAPLRVLFIWYLLTWITYMPLMLWVGAGTWTGFGPFDFQLSRVLLYFGYFLMGVVIGSAGISRGIFGSHSLMMKRWSLWVLAAVLTYLLLKLSEAPLKEMYGQKGWNPLLATLIYRSIWTLSCTLSSIALISLFRKLFPHANRFWQGLSENAYGIYLIHYIFVIWCQFLLLETGLPVVIKFAVTFVASAGLSWGITQLIRKNKTIAKFL